MTSVWSVLRRPRWVVGTVICAVLVGAFVAAGFWQLRRLDERRDRNAVIEARSAQPVQPVEEVVGAGAGVDADELPFRRVLARGEYDAGGEVRVRNRSLDGRPGDHVVTPLVLDDGRAVAVNRGFVPRGVEAPAGPPAGEVEVEGLLQATQERQGIGPTDPAEGRLDTLNRLDLERLQQQYDRELLPVSLQLESSSPPAGELPRPLPEPERDEGSHLSYALQWFVFAGIGLVGWPILLRRVARDRRAESVAVPADSARPLEPLEPAR